MLTDEATFYPFFSLFALALLAQNSHVLSKTTIDAKRSARSASVNVTDSTYADKQLAREAKFYHMMSDQARVEANKAHSDTQWGYTTSVGILIAVVTIIAAAQYLFNFRLNNQKINAFKVQLRAEMADSQRAVLEALSTGHQSNRELINSLAQEIERRMRSEFITRNNSIQIADFEGISIGMPELTKTQSISYRIEDALNSLNLKIQSSEPFNQELNKIYLLLGECKSLGGDILHTTYNKITGYFGNTIVLQEANSGEDFTNAITGLKRVAFYPNNTAFGAKKVNVDEFVQRTRQLI